MLSWLKSFIWKEEKKEETQYPKQIVYPRGHYKLSPLRILEWFHQEKKLDPLPKYPPSPKNMKETSQ
jgi:hypothetical protein